MNEPRPTLKLRWLVTTKGCHPSDGILQQEWEHRIGPIVYAREWRNVAVEAVTVTEHYLATHHA